jgi:hypothetical protein
VCVHDRRGQIERDLVEGATVRAIAGKYGLSASAVDRHQQSHIAERVSKASEARARFNADSLVDRLESLRVQTETVLAAANVALKKWDPASASVALRAIQRLEKQTELVARVVGELRESGPTTNIIVSPEWVEMRRKVLDVVRRHPSLRAEMLEALSGGGSGYDGD